MVNSPDITMVNIILYIFPTFCPHVYVKAHTIYLYMYMSVYIYIYTHTHSAYTYILYESESRSVVSDSLWPHGPYSPWNSTGQNIGVGSLSLLQGIFPSQGLNPCLPHCRGILYQLSYYVYLYVCVCVYACIYTHMLLFIRSVVSNSLWTHGLQYTRPPFPSPSPRVCPNSCSLHWWCHPAISSSHALFSFCP